MTLDPDAKRRYGRQIRLAGIGEAGQARLCAAVVRPAGAGVAGEIEARYLRGAGVATAADGTPGPPVDVAALGLRHPAARDLGEGALRALATIRAVLGGGDRS